MFQSAPHPKTPLRQCCRLSPSPMSPSIGIASNDTTQSSGNSAVPRQGDPVVLPYLIPPAKERCPFDDLPTELTENILTFVVWAYNQRDSGFVETGTGGEVIKHDIRTRLSLVCNSWKEVIRGVRPSPFFLSWVESQSFELNTHLTGCRALE